MTIIEQIENWNGEDIADLRDMVVKARKGNDSTQTELEKIMADLPFSDRVPDRVAWYPVWTVDAKGNALVGDRADDVEPIEDVVDWCDEVYVV